MARKKASRAAQPERQPRPSLVKPRDDVAQKIREQIEKGKEIRTAEVRSEAEFDELKLKRDQWRDFATEYLRTAFSNDSIADEFADIHAWGGMWMNMSTAELLQSFQEGTAKQIGKLESVLGRLELFEESGFSPESIGTPVHVEQEFGSEVFIIHGHDEAVKNSAARFVEKLGLTPIILHEQADRGDTVIEKFERHAGQVGFAIGLLTPDDMGRRASEGDEALQPRARQNVILETGFFLGKLGRPRVRILYRQGVELPSDMDGIFYIPIDDDAWQLRLAKEMKAAGLEFDANRLL